ncbi:alpha-amylase family glycosyl hydrolase [Haploplasma axanthum]|uniref:Cyclomaltodextrinase n=1 Tax=Haploplasma axanthum TaxID=29552 RepID=A0A449BBJ5_HAPAX|nr:alpha-amylase family glycosyl hydrolase [Haploplasma axanthum]VEU79815.1 Cyclomaltodextrinase [Haploplasma axanthum]
MNKYKVRENDWRNGMIVYQVIVDRFAPSNKDKKDLYNKPRVFHSWNEEPKRGVFLEKEKYWSHELDFWGGDLESLMNKMDYLNELGIDCLYLNPIQESMSNHKYDATNYMEISKEYGTKKDLKRLIDLLHENNKKIVLDGVFNHVGVNSLYYTEAIKGNNKYKDWFYFDDKYPNKVRLWADATSLPELNLENEKVREYIYKNDDSVVRSFLKLGIDGWRLDVAFDIGYKYLKELTDYAHKEKEKSLVVGEIWNYPQKWLKSIDGIINFTTREIIIKGVKNEIKPFIVNQMLDKMIEDTGIEEVLKSWNVLDNHDTARLKHILPKVEDQKLAQVLQFTLPGAVNLYYGTELGMDGGDDPLNRAPMKWELVNSENKDLIWNKKLIEIRKNNRALKIGDYLSLISEKFITFIRHTDDVNDTVLVVINPNDEEINENILVRDSDIMNYSNFEILLGEAKHYNISGGMLNITLKAKGFIILKPYTKARLSYTPYKRI